MRVDRPRKADCSSPRALARPDSGSAPAKFEQLVLRNNNECVAATLNRCAANKIVIKIKGDECHKIFRRSRGSGSERYDNHAAMRRFNEACAAGARVVRCPV